MKSDSYLNLCVEQARLSPLHHRHGSIVVKGGKVIGQGFNDFRPGYDGGSALKSGVLPKSAFPLPSVDCAIPNMTPDMSQIKVKASKSNFKCFEAVSGNCGAGRHPNTSLSMHSEMMAINSALASSSTLAATNAQRIKPNFKLQGDSKRKRELRREATAAYVRTVCLAAARGTDAQQQQQRTGTPQTGEWRFEPCASQWNCLPSEAEVEEATPPSSETQSQPQSQWQSSPSQSRRESDGYRPAPVRGSVQAQTVRVA